MATQVATWGGRHGASSPAAWGKFELLDRQSVLVDDDGNKFDKDPELTAALKATLDLGTVAAYDSFLGELLREYGITDMEDLGGEALSAVLRGILD